MASLIKIQSKHNKERVFYFRFFASMKYPNCFWYTLTDESFGFELGKMIDFEPVNKTWKEVRDEEL